jgi:hypothetical protein
LPASQLAGPIRGMHVSDGGFQDVKAHGAILPCVDNV